MRPELPTRAVLIALLALLSALGAGCGGIAHVVVSSMSDGSSGGAPPGSTTGPAPSAQIRTSLSRPDLPDPQRIELRYDLTAAGPSPVDVDIRVALADASGAPVSPFEAAVELPGPPSEGTTGLVVSTTDAVATREFTFVWDVPGNLGLGDAGQRVVLEVAPRQGGVGGTAARSPAFVAGNAPAQVAVEPPSGSTATIPVGFALLDVESDTGAIDVFYRDLEGAFHPATAALPGLTTGLTASPGGEPHVYVWSSDADLPDVSTPSAALLFRPRDAYETGSDRLVEFPLANNAPPFIVADQPRGAQLSGPIAIGYTLFDANGDDCEIDVRFSDDSGRTFKPATPAARGTHDGTRAVPSSPAGARSTFVWDSATDLGPGRLISIRLALTPNDPFAQGNTASVTFDVDDVPLLEEVQGFVSAKAFTFADLDGDGQGDLFAAAMDGSIGFAQYSREDGTASGGGSGTPPAGETFRAPVGAVDFDGDGRLDPVALTDATGGVKVHLYTNRNSQFPPRPILTSSASSILIPGSLGTAGTELRGADLAGAAAAVDIVVAVPESSGGSHGSVRVAVASQTGGLLNGPFTLTDVIPLQADVPSASTAPSVSPALATVGRFDAGVKDDLLLADGTIVYGMTGIGGSFSRSTLPLPGGAALAVHGIAADLDASGSTDAVVVYRGDDGRGKAVIAFGPFAGSPPAPALVRAIDAGFDAEGDPILGTPAGAVADLDGDGRLDLALAVSDGADLRFLSFVQKADRTFAPATPTAEFEGGGAVLGLAAADVDGDGRPELLATVAQGAVVARFGAARAGRVGTVCSGAPFPVRAGPAGAFAFGALRLGSTLSLFRPVAGFREPIGGPNGIPLLEAERVRAADVSGDSFSDLVLHDADGRLEVAEQASGHRLEAPYGSETTGQDPAAPRDMAAGALTLSGRDDVFTATTDAAKSAVSVTFQQPGGILGETSTALPFPAERVVAADLDRALDGREDLLAIAAEHGPGQAVLLRGGMADPVGFAVPLGEGAIRAVGVAVRGARGSGVFVSGAGTPSSAAILVTPAGVSASALGAAFTSFASGDVNGDGEEDMVGAKAGGGLSVFLGLPGSAGFGPPFEVATFLGEVAQLAVADLDGDGRDDIFAAGPSAATVFYQDPGGSLPAATAAAVMVDYAAAPIAAPSSPVVADVDGDGAPDLVGPVNRGGLSAIAALLRRPDGTYERTVVGAAAGPVADLAAADLDGDGGPDLAALRGSPVFLDARLRRFTAPGAAVTLGSGTIGVPPAATEAGNGAGVVGDSAVERDVIVALALFDPERVELRTRPVPTVRRLRTGKLRLPAGLGLAGPPIIGTPEDLPLRTASSVDLRLPVAPGLNLSAPGRRFVAFRLDRGTGSLEPVGDARPDTVVAGSDTRSVLLSVRRLGVFAIGLTANAPPATTVTAVTVNAAKRRVEITYDVADADGDRIRPAPQFSQDDGRTWRPCAQFDAKLPDLVAPGTGRTLVWDMLHDLRGGVGQQVHVRVVPRDVAFGKATSSARVTIRID